MDNWNAKILVGMSYSMRLSRQAKFYSLSWPYLKHFLARERERESFI